MNSCENQKLEKVSIKINDKLFSFLTDTPDSTIELMKDFKNSVEKIALENKSLSESQLFFFAALEMAAQMKQKIVSENIPATAIDSKTTNESLERIEYFLKNMIQTLDNLTN